MIGLKSTSDTTSALLTPGEARGTLISPTGSDGDSPIRQPSVITTQAGSGAACRPERFFVTSTIPTPQPISDTHLPTGSERLGPTSSPRNEPAEIAPTDVVDAAGALAGNDYDRALIRAASAWLASKGYKPTVSGNRITAARRRRK